MYLAHICLNKCHKNTYKHLRHPKWHTYTICDKNGDVELTIRVAATKMNPVQNLPKEKEFIIHTCDPTVVICYLIWACNIAV